MKFDDDANILLASLNSKDAPSGLVDAIKKDMIDRYGERAKVEAEMITDSPIDWKNAIDQFVKDNNYDVVKYCEGEIVVKDTSIINVIKKK